MTIEELLAREAIRVTMALYNTCGDRGAIDEMMRCFTHDAVLTVLADEMRGHDAIRGYFQQIMGTGFLSGSDRRASRHFLATSRIVFDDADTARGWTYFALVRAGEMIQHGVYVDQFRRTGDEWLLSARRVKLDHDALRP